MSRMAFVFSLVAVLVAILVGVVQYTGVGPKNDRVMVIDVLKLDSALRTYFSSIQIDRGAAANDELGGLLAFDRDFSSVVKQLYPGQTVFVKQAVVTSNVIDVTDEVIAAMKLPPGSMTDQHLQDMLYDSSPTISADQKASTLMQERDMIDRQAKAEADTRINSYRMSRVLP